MEFLHLCLPLTFKWFVFRHCGVKKSGRSTERLSGYLVSFYVNFNDLLLPGPPKSKAHYRETYTHAHIGMHTSLTNGNYL